MTFLTGTLYRDCVNEISSNKLERIEKQASADTFSISFVTQGRIVFRFSGEYLLGYRQQCLPVDKGSL